MDELKQAAEESDEQWLTLNWDNETRRLVQSSYGSRLDIEFHYFDGRCPDCQRRFVIGVAPEAAEPAAEPEDAEEAQGETEPAAGPEEPSILRVALTIS